MAKTNQNHDDDDDSSGRKRFKTFEKGGVAPWSDLNHHVLFLVTMQLGIYDFLAFSGVCKSWRSLALSNKNTFMVSRPPMRICIERPHDENERCYCLLEDFEWRSFRTILPHCGDGVCCFGLTRGYLILFAWKIGNFWLVNPITRHELHFPRYPLGTIANKGIRAVLVFSPSISGWVLVVMRRNLWSHKLINSKISFCVAGKRGWTHVSSTFPILDLHVFRGKIYTIRKHCFLGELRLNLKQKGESALHEINISEKPNFSHPWLVSSNESLFLIDRLGPKTVMELDFGEMKWVLKENIKEEYAFYLSFMSPCVAVKPESWAGPLTLFKKYHCIKDKPDYSKECGYFLDSYEDRELMYDYKWVWYLPHECLYAHLLDE